jgi:SAM-dependent methyltransferase
VIFTDFYSDIYDQIHSSKNYDSEASQIARVIKEQKISKDSLILDFGCGTGKHLLNLSTAGYTVSGYDLNENMLLKAKSRNKHSIFYSNYSQIPQRFTFCYSLFDVLSYQIHKEEVDKFLNEICGTILRPGWILLDGWHLSGLLHNPPTSRNRTFEYLNQTLTREVLASTDNNFKVTELSIKITNLHKNETLLQETHFLRAFQSNEISRSISEVGGVDIQFFDGMDYSKPLNETSWRFAVLFKLLK